MGNTSSISAFSILSLGSKSHAESPCPIMRCCLNFPKLLRILPDGFELGIGFGMLLFQSGIRNFRNEKSCTRRFMIFILNSHALSQCATIYERLWRMGIYMHQHRLPRKGRGAGICLKYYCECGAFTVIFPSSRMKVSMKMRIFSPFFELHSWD